MKQNVYGAESEQCWAIPCDKKATHKLVTVVAGDDSFGPFEQHTWYCFEHVLHFSAWLPYVYGDRVTSITPSWEDFRNTWMNK